MKTLIIQTAFIGDVVLATPLIEAIKTHDPVAQVDVLVRKGNEALFEGDPRVGEMLLYNKEKPRMGELLRLIRAVRSNHYDLIINVHRYLSSAIISLAAGAKMTVGFRSSPLSFFYSRRVPHVFREGLHEIDRNLSLLDGLFGTSGIVRPSLYVEDNRRAILAYQAQPYITVSPFSRWATKELPAVHWAAVIRRLSENYNIYLLGGQEEQAQCLRLIGKANLSAEQSGRVHVLTGKISILESAALMEKAMFNFVNDSAGLHLASAVNARVTAVFCSTVTAFGFGPLSDEAWVTEVQGLNCRPCGLHGHKACPEGHFKCGREISVEEMLEPLSALNLTG